MFGKKICNLLSLFSHHRKRDAAAIRLKTLQMPTVRSSLVDGVLKTDVVAALDNLVLKGGVMM